MSIQLEMVSIYILELEDNKYYIGRSKKKTDKGIKSRINAHFNQSKTAAAWCKKYKPIKIVDIKKDQTVYDENKWTKIYMEKYGIENVRGGDYVRVKLTKGDVEKLQREIDAKEKQLKNLIGFDGANNGKLSDTEFLKNLKISENILLFFVLIFVIYAYRRKLI